MRDLGASLMPGIGSGSRRMLAYLRIHTGTVVHGSELMVVSGIDDYPRRIRELRKESGWPILSGVAAMDMRADAQAAGLSDADLPPPMGSDDYLLTEDRQDIEAASRWRLANSIRKRGGPVKERLIAANVGRGVTSEELRYVAGDKSEWARRTRELRTEEGWPVVTKQSGDPNLPMGVYVLAADEQAPPHDRKIKEITRRGVMRRDHYSCQWHGCGWSVDLRDRDPRFLEVHHVEHHANGGSNEADNLVTLCNLHHDECHRTGELHLNPETAKLLSI
jgi:hypothetical protein